MRTHLSIHYSGDSGDWYIEMGNQPAFSKTSPVTEAVTKPSPAVTGGKRALKVHLSREELGWCEMMHFALVLAFDIDGRSGGGRVGPARLQAVWPDAKTDWQAYGWSPTHMPPVRPNADEIALRDVVFDALPKVFARDVYGAQLVTGRALRVSWPQLQRKDPRGRGERMIKYLHQNALLQMWCVVGARVQSLLHTLQQF